MRVFGLTGGIACGKSAVSAYFKEQGVPVIDADVLAREVVEPGTDGLRAVVKEFGEKVLAKDGSLDRKALAAIVFGDDEKRKRLNAILHPRIGALSMKKVQQLDEKGEELACYEAPLLVENNLAHIFRPLVVVIAPESVQIARMMKRDNATEDEAYARIRPQMPNAEKAKIADYVIDNSGTLIELTKKAAEVLKAIRA